MRCSSFATCAPQGPQWFHLWTLLRSKHPHRLPPHLPYPLQRQKCLRADAEGMQVPRETDISPERTAESSASKYFEALFKVIKLSRLPAVISGPIPPLPRGSGGRFSRTLSLHTWLQFACKVHNLDYIDNFNLSWNRVPFFKKDGLHPNRLGYTPSTVDILPLPVPRPFQLQVSYLSISI